MQSNLKVHTDLKVLSDYWPELISYVMLRPLGAVPKDDVYALLNKFKHHTDRYITD